MLFSGDFPNLDISICEHVYYPGWWELNIQHVDATKPNAIRHLMREMGFDSDGLTVFGDHANDIGMFAAASRRVAPTNAIREILKMATEIVESNEEDGVAKFLTRDFQRLELKG
jgi:5-amino-6-(5-phospho-D-ribitylamino)uracil phosphatase